MKIHELIRECSSLVEANVLDPPTRNDLSWRDTVNFPSFHPPKTIYYSNAHAGWKTRRHCNGYQIEKLQCQIFTLYVFPEFDNENDVGNNGKQEQKENKLGCLPIKPHFTISGETYDSDKLTLDRRKARSGH